MISQTLQQYWGYFCILCVLAVMVCSFFNDRRNAGVRGIAYTASDGRKFYRFVNSYIDPTFGISSSTVELRMEAQGVPEFLFSHRDTAHRIAERLELAKGFHTGDVAFDEAVFVEADDARLHESLIADAQLRKFIKDLLADAVFIAKKSNLVSIRFRGNSSGQFDLPHRPEKWLDKMEAIESRLPHDPLIDKTAENYTVNANVLITLFCALGFIGAVAAVCVTHQHIFILNQARLWLMMFLMTLLGSTIFAALVKLWLGGSTQAYSALKWLCVFGVPGIAACCYAALYNINTDYDTSKPQIDRQRILKKYVRHDRRGDSLHVVIEDWRLSDKPFDINADEPFYRALNVGDYLLIAVRPGYLGCEWMEYSREQ